MTGSMSAFGSVPADGPRVVLKLDDLVDDGGRVPERWARLIRFIETRGIKTSIGIIGNSLEGEKPAYFGELKRLQATGLIEFWHHGYDHRRWQEDGKTVCEFSGTAAAHQQEHFQRTQHLAKEKLGITFRTFGAPFNTTDGNTITILTAHPEIQVWLQGDAKETAGKFVIRMDEQVNIEHPVHHPDFAVFTKAYQAKQSTPPPCYLLQGHPGSWDEASFAEFTRIIGLLETDKLRFVHPADLPGLLR